MRHCERDESGEHGRAKRITLLMNVTTDERDDVFLGRTVAPVLLVSINKAHIPSTCGSLAKSLTLSGIFSENDSRERKRPGPTET